MVLGESGAGKSTLCNVLTGKLHDAEEFPVSPVEEGRTHAPIIVNAFYRGEQDKPFKIMDTQGFNDPGDHENPNDVKNEQDLFRFSIH